MHDRGVDRGIAEAKRQLRTQLRRARESRSAADVERVAAGLLAAARAGGLLHPAGGADDLGPAIVAAYLAMPGEPDPGLLCVAVRGAGGTVLLPRPVAGRAMDWVVDDGTRTMAAPPLRVPIPTGPAVGTGAIGLVEAAVQVVFLPALAVDATGNRLGQGAGFYDRLLADLTLLRSAGRQTPRLVALVHDDEAMGPGRIPVDAHDQPIDAALTPSGLRVFD